MDVEKFRERIGMMGRNGRSIEEMMKQDIRKIRKALEEEQEGGRKKIGWWNEKYREKKIQARRKLRNWRRGIGHREEYTRARKECKELCEK